jgi:hypothetical protein
MSSNRKYVLLLLVMIFNSACPKRVSTVVIPSDRNIVAISGEVGYFKISGGYLKDIYGPGTIAT